MRSKRSINSKLVETTRKRLASISQRSIERTFSNGRRGGPRLEGRFVASVKNIRRPTKVPVHCIGEGHPLEYSACGRLFLLDYGCKRVASKESKASVLETKAKRCESARRATGSTRRVQ